MKACILTTFATLSLVSNCLMSKSSGRGQTEPAEIESELALEARSPGSLNVTEDRSPASSVRDASSGGGVDAFSSSSGGGVADDMGAKQLYRPGNEPGHCSSEDDTERIGREWGMQITRFGTFYLILGSRHSGTKQPN